jgi:hypothetical protein
MTDDTVPLVIDQTAEAPTEQQPAAPVARARIRAGAVVWGVLVLAAGALVLMYGGDPQRRAEAARWLGTLTPSSIGVIAVVAAGAIVLLLALLSVVRRSQRGD